MKWSHLQVNTRYDHLERYSYGDSAAFVSVIVPRRDEKDHDDRALKSNSRVEVTLAEDSHPMPDRDLQTRNLSLVGLIFT